MEVILTGATILNGEALNDQKPGSVPMVMLYSNFIPDSVNYLVPDNILPDTDLKSAFALESIDVVIYVHVEKQWTAKN